MAGGSRKRGGHHRPHSLLRRPCPLRHWNTEGELALLLERAGRRQRHPRLHPLEQPGPGGALALPGGSPGRREAGAGRQVGGAFPALGRQTRDSAVVNLTGHRDEPGANHSKLASESLWSLFFILFAALFSAGGLKLLFGAGMKGKVGETIVAAKRKELADEVLNDAVLPTNDGGLSRVDPIVRTPGGGVIRRAPPRRPHTGFDTSSDLD